MIDSSMRENFLGSFPLNLFKLPLFPFPEQRVLKHKVLILLLDLMKIIHVKLKINPKVPA